MNTPTDPFAVARRLIELAEKATPKDESGAYSVPFNLPQLTQAGRTYVYAAINTAPILAAEVKRLTALVEEREVAFDCLVERAEEAEAERDTLRGLAEGIAEAYDDCRFQDDDIYNAVHKFRSRFPKPNPEATQTKDRDDE